jgi:hypothetical protein
MNITAEDKLQCVIRELGYRHRVYPRLVGKGKMSQTQADRETKLMEAIVQDYRRVSQVREPGLFDGDAAA